MSSSFELADLDRLTVGTVGPPGQRVFYLQAASGARVVSLKVEKTQVAALVAYLMAMLADLPVPAALPSEMALEEPVVPEWVVGTLGITYDEPADRVLLVAEELVEEGTPEKASARFSATREQVAALAAQGAKVVAAGRPTCQLCGQPVDPEGHVCVRLNGHRSPTR